MLIKKILRAVVILTSVILTSNHSQTQAQQTYFLQGTNGQNIDLGHLCGNNSPPSTSLSTPPSQGIFKVPIKRRESGIPVVEVTFNGKHTFEMLFDTGASGITISPNMASTIGIQSKKEALSQTAGGIVPIGISQVSSVKAGELSASDVEVFIIPSLPGIGLLGQTFYGNYDVTIKENQIELRPRP